MFRATPVTAPHTGKIQVGNKVFSEWGKQERDPGISGIWLAERAVRFQACVAGRRGVSFSSPSSPSLPSATSLLCVTEFPSGTLGYRCLIFSPADTSAHGSAVLKGRKTRKGFARNSAHTGSRVEETSPALQARWGLSFAWASGKICSMPVNWTGSLQWGRENPKRLNRWGGVKLVPVDNLYSSNALQSHFISL